MFGSKDMKPISNWGWSLLAHLWCAYAIPMASSVVCVD